jgi:hypothetical protein
MECRVEMYQKKTATSSFYNKSVLYFIKITEAGSCWTSKGAGHCVHGRCVASEDGSTFSCQCDPGYSGQFCTDSKSCYSSSSSSLSLLYSNKSRFVCCVTLKNKKKKRQEENGPMKNHCPTIYE